MKTITWKKISLLTMAVGFTAVSYADDTNMAAGPMNQGTNQPPKNRMERVWSEITAQEFVTDASMGGMKEVRLSEMALANSQNQEVKDFAHRMITDHTQANNKLAQLALAKGLELPGTNTFAADDPNWNNPMITGSEQIKDAYLLKTNLAIAAYQDFRELKGLSGREFDQAYAKDMVMDHVNTVIEFEAAKRMLLDPDLKNFAQQTLPTLIEHRQMARKLSAELNGAPMANSEMETNHESPSSTAENMQH